ncbi:transcriptional regulator [Paenibacillus sp. FSL H8-0548]|uniref:RrF2 family transcriptional regulator n=1 Tax=Paenibacillus sp. FSL H8-0548 TaxID=1920422 RepID=UPI00096FD91D|nr:Rrf2 family transcriptional regulator [Paenibacillus sp. FSL H8-0548]OMF30835.1 transcriptional regulator [Paenibacillus sp. FSL H8-0548]
MKLDKPMSMSHSKWFGHALQALVFLSHKSEVCSSAAIAGCLKSEATQLRRVLAKLAAAQIITTREGRDGGYRLMRSPESITLAEVYIALKVGEPLCSGMLDTVGIHAAAPHMKSAFVAIANEIEQKTIETLQQHTIAQLAERTLVSP